jgi:hypothetical protein
MRREESVMKKLLVYLLPVILLSEAAVRQSLLYNGIAVPVMILWLINTLLVFMPERVETECTVERSVCAIESRSPALEKSVTELHETTRQVA